MGWSYFFFFHMMIPFIAHLWSGLKPSSLVSPCTNSIFPAHPQTHRKRWVVWVMQWVIVPSKAFSMFLAGLSLPVRDLCAGGNEELGLYKAPGRHKSLGFPGSFSNFWWMDKPGAGTIYCNEFLFLRWKGNQINGFTNQVAPSASACEWNYFQLFQILPSWMWYALPFIPLILQLENHCKRLPWILKT